MWSRNELSSLAEVSLYYIQDGQSADRGFTQSLQTLIPHNIIYPPLPIVLPTIRVHLTVHFDYKKNQGIYDSVIKNSLHQQMHTLLNI
jgi:hypothetical protein